MALRIVYACIARDEEPHLARHLESLQRNGGIADSYLVCVDEATTDRTAEVAAALGARVEHSRFEGSIAVLRQAAADLAAESADVVVMLDPDEVLAGDPAKVRAELEQGWAEGVRIFHIAEDYEYDDYGDCTLAFNRYVAWGPAEVRFIFHHHETLIGRKGPVPERVLTSATMEHRPIKKPQDKPRVFHAAARRSYEAHPKNPRSVFYLGYEHVRSKFWPEAVGAFETTLRMSENPALRLRAQELLAESHRMLGDRKRERAVLLEALGEHASIRDPYIWLCEAAGRARTWIEACAWGEAALAIPLGPQVDRGHWRPHYYRHHPHDLLAIAYYRAGDKARGRLHLDRALEYQPGNKRLLENRRFFD
ncbi:MAG: hypothetical protein SF028_00585 [Candidatus Sumerlaeia bacterium]|nr:hypothetical protein [Candidatus Sumerlaeia bacterium]